MSKQIKNIYAGAGVGLSNHKPDIFKTPSMKGGKDNIENLGDGIKLVTEYRGNLEVRSMSGSENSGGFFKSFRLRQNDVEFTNPYRQNPWVFSGINSIGTNVSSVPFKIFTEVADNKDTKEKFKGVNRKTLLRKINRSEFKSLQPKVRATLTPELLKQKGVEEVDHTDNQLVSLFRDVNPLMDATQLWKSTIIYLYNRGECFWVLESAGDEPLKEGEIPTEIWPYGPEYFEPIIDKETKIITGWRYKPPFGENSKGDKDHIDYTLNQIIRFYFYNPDKPSRGLSPLSSTETDLRQDFKSSIFNESFFDNGGDPGGILYTEKGVVLSEEQREAINKSWKDKHDGIGKNDRTALLEGGVKYERNPVTMRDMQFTGTRKWAREVVSAVLKVPKAELTIYEDINYATALSADKSYWTKTLIPLMSYFENVLDSNLFSKVENGKYWGAFDFSSITALQEDIKTKLESAIKLQALGYTTNQINERLSLGMPDVEWGNAWWAPFNVQPISGKPPTDTGEETESMKNLNIMGLHLRKKNAKERYWEAYVAQVNDPNEKRFQKKIKSYFFSLRRDQLQRFNDFVEEHGDKAVENRAITLSDVEKILFSKGDWNNKVRKISRPLYVSTMDVAIEQLSNELGGLFVFNMNDPKVAKFLAKKELKVTGINNTVRKTLRNSLTEGLNQGETIAKLQDRIRGVFNNTASLGKTLQIARTETAQAASGVRQIAMEAEGIEKGEWVDAGDENTREDHVFLGSLGPKPLGHNYANDIGSPGVLEYPSDMRGAADQVINCRCILIAAS